MSPPSKRLRVDVDYNVVPAEIWEEIASHDLRAYAVLVRAIPLFARSITTERNLAFQQMFTTVNTAPNGTKRYSINGRLHRVDGPAIEGPDRWRRHVGVHGILSQWLPHGFREWHLNGWLHRIDGPAFESAYGDKAWYLQGKRHRTDGPAVENIDGTVRWYINGEEVIPFGQS